MTSVLSRVDPGLYVTNEAGASSLESLMAASITLVVNLSLKIPCHFEDSEDVEIRYIEARCRDKPKTDIVAVFESIHHEIRSEIENGGNVLLHCRQGRSRSVSIAIAYLMATHGWGYFESLQAVRKVHSIARPHSSFQKQLLLTSPKFDEDDRTALIERNETLERENAVLRQNAEIDDEQHKRNIAVLKDIQESIFESMDRKSVLEELQEKYPLPKPPAPLTRPASPETTLIYLRQENMILERRNVVLESKVETLRDQIHSVEELAKAEKALLRIEMFDLKKEFEAELSELKSRVNVENTDSSSSESVVGGDTRVEEDGVDDEASTDGVVLQDD